MFSSYLDPSPSFFISFIPFLFYLLPSSSCIVSNLIRMSVSRSFSLFCVTASRVTSHRLFVLLKNIIVNTRWSSESITQNLFHLNHSTPCNTEKSHERKKRHCELLFRYFVRKCYHVAFELRTFYISVMWVVITRFLTLLRPRAIPTPYPI
jgi:hypothetical protein